MPKIGIWLMGMILLVSCTTTELDNIGTDKVVEGEPIRMNLSLAQPELATRAGLSPTQEKGVNSVFVLVFNSQGVKVTQTFINSNITASLHNIQTVSGAGMSIYVFANLSTQNTGASRVQYAFNAIHTIDQLNAMNLINLATDLNLNKDLVMYGSAVNQTLTPNATTSLNVQLSYVAAKVTLYMVTKLTISADAFSLTDWSVKNYPNFSYLMPQATDAVASGATGAYSNSVTTLAWADTIIAISGIPTPAKYAFLYMYENRRGGRVAGSPSDVNQQNKTAYAPNNATAVVMRGYYKSATNGSVTGITATVYLGANNYDDYNVNRGYDYSYIVTVKGITNINVDSRVVGNTYGYQVNLFNPTLDCHPDSRPLRISSWPGNATISILESDGVTPVSSNSWLKVSRVNLSQAVNVGGVYKRPTYNPTTAMVTELNDIVFPPSSSMTDQMFYLYADENLTSSTRTLVVKVIGTEALAGSQPITFTVQQLGYQTMGNVGGRLYTTAGAPIASTDYVMLVENIEEATLKLTPGAAAGTEQTTTMQWGYNLSVKQPITSVSTAYYNKSGYANTGSLVYSSGFALLPAFGRLSAASASTASVTISEQFVNPIFNVNPMRYCFEKNRDLDGDGLISNPNTLGVDEINWFLPATDQLYQTYVGQYSLPYALSGANYQTSSEFMASNSQTNSISYGSGASGPIAKSTPVSVRCVRYMPASGVTTPVSPYVESGTGIVNCSGFKSTSLRTAAVGYPTPIHSQANVVNQKLSPRFLVAKANTMLYGNSGANTMTWAEANGWTLSSNTTTSVGVLASPATGCQAYSEPGYPAGTWRVPTQRELYVIMALRPDLLASGYAGYVDMNTMYWSSTYIASSQGWFAGMYNNYISLVGKTSLYSVRCVHDM